MLIKKSQALFIAGLGWLLIALMLFVKSFRLLSSAPQLGLGLLLCLITGSLLLGWVKGRMVLKKSAQKVCSRIKEQKEPLSLLSIYPKSYLILIPVMASLGIFLKTLPLLMHAAIDLAVATALFSASFTYFFEIRKTLTAQKRDISK